MIDKSVVKQGERKKKKEEKKVEQLINNKMIDDERCRRVMNKFRKRRRERIFNEANSLSEDSTAIASSYCSRRRKRDTDDDSDDGGNLFDGDKRKTNFSATSNCFGSSFLFPSSRKHINYRKNWGENIARRRAFTNNDNNDNNDDSYHHHRHQDNHNHNTKINTQTTILPEIIHRKPESIHNASSYNRCLFLDSYDKVMGIDSDTKHWSPMFFWYDVVIE